MKILFATMPFDGLRQRLTSAICFALGGAVWVLHSVVVAARPEGCIAAGCGSGSSPRQTEDLAWLFLISVGLIAVGTASLARRETGPGQRLATAAAWLCIAGTVALVLGIVINATLVGDSPLWWLHDTDSLGRFLPVAGGFLLGLAVVRAREPARWPGFVLIAGALVSLGFNAQTERVLLTLPLGLAWISLGYALFRTTDARRHEHEVA